MAPAAGGRELDQTPTWAVLVVCTAIIVVSILLEKVFHWLGHMFTEKKKMAMVEALEKVKAELMILGFISLMLTFTQNYVVKICIPVKVADTMLPCSLAAKEAYPKNDAGNDAGKDRRLLWEDVFMDMDSKRRFLAAPVGNTCSDGKVPLISINGLHQLHIFIFFLAVFHVLSSGLIMALGRLKIRGWKYWENETLSLDYEFSSDPSRFHYVQDNNFVRQHASCWNKNVFLLYITSFFRQFFRSVRKEDYLMMRHGFINAHLAPGRKFDFRRYITRSLEDDFKVVVGISPILWASAGLLLLLNLKGWYTMFWISFLPVIILLAVGTKLQAIIAEMAVEIADRNVMVQGVPLVSLGDHHFWFKSPRFVLYLIHFTLFQNAFQLVYFLWIWYSFGLNSCFHENGSHLTARVCLGIFVQILCSYVTLPLYALVSQLGSTMKRTIFDEHTAEALKKWHNAAKKHHNERSATHTPARSPPRSPRISPNHPSSGTGPSDTRITLKDSEQGRPVHTQSSSSLRRRDLEMGSITPQNEDTVARLKEDNIDDFSFVKAAKNPHEKDIL